VAAGVAAVGPEPEPEPQGDDEDAAAARIQAMQRGKQARAELQEQQQAATKVQAVQRGKQARGASVGTVEAEAGAESGPESEAEAVPVPGPEAERVVVDLVIPPQAVGSLEDSLTSPPSQPWPKGNSPTPGEIGVGKKNSKTYTDNPYTMARL
jgi:hypothetical protein